MVRRALTYVVLVALAGAAGGVALAACGPSASDVPFLREAGDHCPLGGCVDSSILALDDGGDPITWDPLEEWDGGDAGGPLSGIFAVEATVLARAGVEVQSKQLYRLRILQQGAWIHQKTTLCSLSLPSISGTVTLAIPDNLRTLIRSRSTETEGTYLSTDQIIQAKYLPPPFLQVFGASLANPATDPLPTMDSGVATDDDGDGLPGVTLIANTIVCSVNPQKLYVALRVSGELGGTVQTPDIITGLAQIHLDESVVGYSDPCLSVASMIKISVEPNSPFRAQRVGAAQDLNGDGNVSCPEIVDTAATVFPDWASP